MKTDDNKMTAAERRDLSGLIRQRARLMKAQAAQRGNELMADFEAQLSSIFSYDDDETWKAARAIAQEAAEDAKVVIAERCRELGIPKQFAPTLTLHWYERGENASKDRRAELRNAAKARIAAMEAAAKTEIESISVNGQTELVADGRGPGGPRRAPIRFTNCYRRGATIRRIRCAGRPISGPRWPFNSR